MKLERKHAFPLTIVPFLLALGFVLFKIFTANKIVNPETGRTSRISLKPEEENRLGLEAYQQVRKEESKGILQSGEEVDLVQRITRRLAQAAAKKTSIDYQWEVSVIQSNQKNAFCLPGGKIVVYTGIIPIAQNEAGLATVLAHEMAHATSRHGAERIFRADITQTILGGIQGTLAQMDPQQRQTIMGALGAGAKYGKSLPFSRQQESEADRVGLLYMARAGYNPREAILFWQRMNEESSSSAHQPEFLSSHPSHLKRIEQLQSLLPEALKEYQQVTQPAA